MNFLKPIFLRRVGIFHTVNLAQEHCKRAGIDAVRSVECLIDDEPLARLRVLCYGLDAVEAALEVPPDLAVLWCFARHSVSFDDPSLYVFGSMIIGSYRTSVKSPFPYGLPVETRKKSFIIGRIRVKLGKEG